MRNAKGIGLFVILIKLKIQQEKTCDRKCFSVAAVQMDER